MGNGDTELRALRKSWPVVQGLAVLLGVPALVLSCFQVWVRLPPTVASQGIAIEKAALRIEMVEKGLQEQREMAIRSEERGKRMEEMIREMRDDARGKRSGGN